MSVFSRNGSKKHSPCIRGVNVFVGLSRHECNSVEVVAAVVGLIVCQYPITMYAFPSCVLTAEVTKKKLIVTYKHHHL